LKRRLLSTIRGTGIWTVEDLMQAVACSDRELLLQCCRELVDDGHIGEGPPDQPAAEHLPEHLPGHMAFDLPKDWQPPIDPGFSPAARKAMARAALGVVTVDTPPTTQTELTEEQIQELMGDDASKLSDTERNIRRYAIIRYGAQWRQVGPTRVHTEAEGNELYEKEVGPLHHISTFRRALGRKALRKPPLKIY
jgi:hypothetical protein